MSSNQSNKRPYGSWKSPITPGMITEGARIFNELAIDEEKGEIYWIEVRPDEEGRCVIVKEDNGTHRDITPAGFSALTQVYEYGGGAMAVSAGTVYFSNDPGIAENGDDPQQLYKKVTGKRPYSLTNPLNLRYGDLIIDKTHDRIICLREDHMVLQKNYPSTDIVGIDIKGIKEQHVLVPVKNSDLPYTRDYYSSPSISPSGKKLAWLAWNFGRMPWDSNELWTADIKKDGSLDEASIKKIAGDTALLEEGASFFQPQWGPDDNLYFVCDHDFSTAKIKHHNWWNLYRFNTKANDIERILEEPPKNAEFAAAQWYLGMSCYGFLSPTEIIAAYNVKNEWRLGYIDTTKKTLSPLEIKFDLGTEEAHKRVNNIEQVRIHAETRKVVFCAGGPYQVSSVVSFEHNPEKSQYTLTVLREGSDRSIFKPESEDKKPLSEYISEGKPITFPTTEGDAHAFYYPPQNIDYHAPSTEKPPLLIIAHGGPTAATAANLNMELQYFNSRGFAVVDVNYRGSTGYGREYRLSLYKNWGIFDRDDCVKCAEYLAKEDTFGIDKKRVISRGKSAGGYLTMVLATYTSLLSAGASYAGISDLTFIRDQTDKLEAYYAIELVTDKDNPVKEFEIRSPINNIDLMDCPMIFFQGERDGIVPPDQTKMMEDALKKKGKPVEVILFSDESHHFHKAKNIIESLEKELKFYSENLGFELDDES